MTLTAKDVAEITRLLEESSFDELYLELDGLKVSLKRGAVANAPGGGGALAPAVPVPVATLAAAPSGAARDIPAPLLGTFYRSPKPGAPPFVEVGSLVEADTIIAIIEVMKLMNTVRAGVRGNVTEILARDGTLVEYGQTLMRVNKVTPGG